MNVGPDVPLGKLDILKDLLSQIFVSSKKKIASVKLSSHFFRDPKKVLPGDSVQFRGERGGILAGFLNILILLTR